MVSHTFHLIVITLCALSSLSLVAASQAGTGWFTLNISHPESHDQIAGGCIILSQLTFASLDPLASSSTSKAIIQKSIPVCPPTPDEELCNTSNDVNVTWPLTRHWVGFEGDDEDGDEGRVVEGVQTSLVLYSGFEAGTEGEGGKAACAMELSHKVVQSLLDDEDSGEGGSRLTWYDKPKLLYNDKTVGFVGTQGEAKSVPLTCRSNGPLLPLGLRLPDPYCHKINDEIWSKPIELTIHFDPESDNETTGSKDDNDTDSTDNMGNTVQAPMASIGVGDRIAQARLAGRDIPVVALDSPIAKQAGSEQKSELLTTVTSTITDTAPSGSSVSSSGDGGVVCTPVTITEMQTVTVTTSLEKRWWMEEGF